MKERKIERVQNSDLLQDVVCGDNAKAGSRLK